MKIKKSVLIAIIIVVLLVVAFSILLVFYLRENKQQRENFEQGKITIINDQTMLGSFDLNQLEQLCSAKTFQAVYKPSGRVALQKEYKGIELRELLEAMEVDIQNAKAVIFKASDGLQKTYNINDVMQQGNVFIAYMVEGKPFNNGILAQAYSKPQEDGGPFVVIKAKDEVSQNRVKMLTEIAVLYA